MKMFPLYLPAAFILVTAASAKEPVQFHIESRIIQGPAAVIPHGKIVSPEASKVRIKEVSSEKGWDVLSAPSVVTREDQDATVEVGREIVLAPGEKPAFAGIKLSVKLRSAPDGAIRVTAKGMLSQASGEKEDSAPLLKFEREIDAPVPPGHTVSIVVPTKDPAQLATFLLTPRFVGGAGKPIPGK